MTRLTRRSFVGHSALSFAALSTAVTSANAQLVYTSSDWKLADFGVLIKSPARVKQVYDEIQIGGGRFLNNIKNSLNGLHFGFGIPTNQIKVVSALHGPANLLNFDDYVWHKYRIGEWLKISDPQSGEPAVRNPFFASRISSDTRRDSQDPNDETSLFQDTSIQTLQARGVQFLCCHTATEEQARSLIKDYSLPQTPEEIVKDLLAHLLPGVLVVASMSAAIALLQSEGHYSYITA